MRTPRPRTPTAIPSTLQRRPDWRRRGYGLLRRLRGRLVGRRNHRRSDGTVLGDDSGIFAQVFDKTGKAVGDPFLVNQTVAASRTARRGHGLQRRLRRHLDQLRPGGDNGDIYARRFNVQGAAVTNEIAGQHDQAGSPGQLRRRHGRQRRLHGGLAERPAGRQRLGRLRPAVHRRRKQARRRDSESTRTPWTSRSTRPSPWTPPAISWSLGRASARTAAATASMPGGTTPPASPRTPRSSASTRRR